MTEQPETVHGQELNDLRLEMRIKSNTLWKAIHRKHRSVAALCRTHEELALQEQAIGKLLAFKMSPFKKTSQTKGTSEKEYRRVCLLLVKVLKIPPEELFPEELYERFVGMPTSKAIEASSFNALPGSDKKKLLQLAAPAENPSAKLEFQELQEKLTNVLDVLQPRERQIVEMRFGLPDGVTYTLEELALIFWNFRSKGSPNRSESSSKITSTTPGTLP